jgi:uncharacterized membrane protein
MTFDVFAEASLAIQSHIVLAVGAIVVGGLHWFCLREPPRIASLAGLGLF